MKEGSRDIISEVFRVFRSNIDFMFGKNSRQNVLVITPFNPDNGKLSPATNIVMSLAIKKKRILVIDGDLRHGSISPYVDFPKVGLSDYLGDRANSWKEIIVKDKQYDNPHVLPIGIIPPNPTELLEGDKLISLVGALRNEYDYISIDCPPIDVVAGAQIIEELADRVVSVIRSGSLDRSMLSELENICQEKRLKNLGVILNDIESIEGRYSYRHGYRYGYHNSSYYYGSNA